MGFEPSDIAYVDIYPPINIARVGDSSEYFIGPEVPGLEPIPDGGFKDSNQKIKKQVARYRVYAFDKNSNVLGELDNPEEYSLTWTVHLANKKGSWVHFRGKFRPETWSLRNYNVEKDGPKEQDCDWPANQPKSYEYTNTRKWLIIDSGEQVVEGASTNPVALQGEFYGENKAPTQVELGEIRTDEKGRLLVFASDGDSRSIANSSDPYPELPNGFDADNWVDKMSDGTVRVTVKSKAQPDLKIAVKNRATIITAAPRFASGTYCPTTLYDLIEDVYEGPKRSQPGYDVGDVVYYRDIYPLFNRIYLLSWTTQPADDGHGPNNMDVFNDSELADPTADNGPRKSIFKRLRLPVIEGDKANEEARDKQANKRFMPYLSGDNGDHPETSSDPNDRNRWASLSQLQYGRLEKWSQGNFTTGEKEVPYESFDKIPLAEQPSALTRAPLERCVGAPMYPGIEVFWVAQLEEMYKLEDKYRFADSVTPGDLSKGLCLPWQSDFNMCNTYWWPSIRPDNVVTDTYFQQQLQQFQSNLDQLASNLENRERWDRGIKGSEIQTGVPIEANSDMVRHWRDLGFVARQLYGATSDNLPEIYIEKQRNPNFPPA